MTTFSDQLKAQTETVIRDRMLSTIPADIDKSEGSYLWYGIAPSAIETALSYINAQEMLRVAFPQTSDGEYLDLHCELKGITRKQATKATGEVKFTGTLGVVIPAGTIVSTASNAATNTESVVFVTTASVTLTSGVAYAPVEALNAGSAGNVLPSTITLLQEAISGVTAVINESATTGGSDIEDDASLLSRLLTKAKTQSTGGNYGDYINWASEVNGVGGVSVVPHEQGPNSVSVYIIDADKLPANQTLVESVQDYICPLHELAYDDDTFTTAGFGVSNDPVAVALKFEYSADGEGSASKALTLPQAGLWIAETPVKVDSTTGADDLLEIGVYNVSADTWATATYNGSTLAKITVTAAQLSTEFSTLSPIEFWWNGADNIEFRVKRLRTDTATVAWFDGVTLTSAFGRDDADTIAPLSHRVTVLPALSVTIDVSATLEYASGYDPADVRASVETSIANYIKSVGFKTDNDVLYPLVGFNILNTAGVRSYSNLLVNGATDNIVIDKKSVAVVGAITLT